jgi:hypothetical protein
MKTFKSPDLFIQVILPALTGVAFITDNPECLNPMVFILVFAAVQIISIIANPGAGSQPWKKTSRRKYHLIGIALVFAAIIVALLQNSNGRTGDKDDKYNMSGLGTLIFATIPAILIALFYTVIPWIEWKKMKKMV